MALSIKNQEADSLARQLTRITGETLTDAIVISLRERLERKRLQVDARPLAERIMEVGRDCARLPLLDSRPPEAILGYDQDGLPT